MIKFVLFLLLTNLAYCHSTTYGNIPQVTMTNVEVNVDTSGLTTMFNAAKEFVNLVFVPFSQITPLVTQAISNDVSLDIVRTLEEYWIDFLKLQVPLIVCLGFGLLFVVFVPLVGSIICCCRCCCNKCGGKKYQTRKRTKSKWRVGLCLGLFVCTAFIVVPGATVIFTNEALNTLVKEVPPYTDTILDNSIRYVDSIGLQMQHILDQLNVLSKIILGRIRDLPDFVQTSLQRPLLALFDLSNATLLATYTNELHINLDSYEDSRSILYDSIERLITNFSNAKSNHMSNLDDSNCFADTACKGAYDLINGLPPLSQEYSESKATEISFMQTYNSSCGTLFLNLESTVIQNFTNEINNAVSSDLISSLESGINSTLNTQLTSIQNTLNGITLFSTVKQQITEIQAEIQSHATTYADHYDRYRWAVGLGLGTVILLIGGCYFFGIFFGCLCGSSKTLPTKRGGFSNFGGILAMSGAGFSFIFSWLLMVIVILAFVVGGALQRYICESLRSPYEGFKFADNLYSWSISAGSSGLSSGSSTEYSLKIYDIITRCESNEGIINVIGLQNTFNLTSYKQTALQHIADQEIDFTLNNPTSLYSSEMGDCLMELNLSSAIQPITLAGALMSYESEIAQLKEYQRNLGTTAVSFNVTLTDAIKDFSAIQATLSALSILEQMYVDSASSANINIDAITMLIPELASYLPAAETNFNTNVPILVTNVKNNFSNVLVSDVETFFAWVDTQVNNLGACHPIYAIYNDIMVIFCEHFIPILNGLWFSIGCSVFFMITGTIFAMKLAKFYRRMDETDVPAVKLVKLEMKELEDTKVSRPQLRTIRQNAWLSTNRELPKHRRNRRYQTRSNKVSDMNF
ncbi:prominin-1-A-like isoform X1 [Clavelina lepadiformis]|uniref:prominin-1-A-like isoform X1 n=2 Tax=Clavelina lepadiformis TaxID=159417 RepID=UPI004041B97B